MLVDGLGAPDAQLVDRLAAEADDRDVVGDGEDVLRVLDGIKDAIALGMGDDVAAEADANGLVGTAHLPRIALRKPFVRDLDLASVDDLLLEEAVAIAHAVAVACDPLVGHGVEEARRQTAQAAVAERRIGLKAADLIEVATHVGEGLGDYITYTEVDQVVVEQPPDEELDGEIVDALLAILLETLIGLRGDGARL